MSLIEEKDATIDRLKEWGSKRNSIFWKCEKQLQSMLEYNRKVFPFLDSSHIENE